MWWWTGGFGVLNQAGGPADKTLAEWETVLSGLSSDFAGAELTVVSVGVGSFNQGQIGYFDNVTIAGTDANASYDFEPLPASKAECMAGGWADFTPEFRNQGDCVSFVATGGKPRHNK